MEIKNEFVDLPALNFGYKYVLKELRQGYLYVIDKRYSDGKRLYCYEVGNNGILAEVKSDVSKKIDYEDFKVCFRDRNKLGNALLLPIPDPEIKGSLQITFSVVRWTKDMQNKIINSGILDEYATNFKVGENQFLEMNNENYYKVFPKKTFATISIEQPDDSDDSDDSVQAINSKIKITSESPAVQDNIAQYNRKNDYEREAEEIQKRLELKRSYMGPVYKTLFLDRIDGKIVDIRYSSIMKSLAKKNKNKSFFIPVMDISALLFDISESIRNEIDEIEKKYEREIFCSSAIELQKKIILEEYKSDYFRKLVNRSKNESFKLNTVPKDTGGYLLLNDDPFKNADEILERLTNEIPDGQVEREAEEHWDDKYKKYYSADNLSYWKKRFDSEIKGKNKKEIRFLENLYCCFYKADYLKTYFKAMFSTNEIEHRDNINFAFTSEYTMLLADITTCLKAENLLFNEFCADQFSDSLLLRALTLNNKKIQDNCEKAINDQTPFITLDKLYTKVNKIFKYGLKDPIKQLYTILIMKLSGIFVRFINFSISKNVTLGMSVVRFLTGTNFKNVSYNVNAKNFLKEMTDVVFDLNRSKYINLQVSEGQFRDEFYLSEEGRGENSKQIKDWKIKKALKSETLAGLKDKKYFRNLNKNIKVDFIVCEVFDSELKNQLGFENAIQNQNSIRERLRLSEKYIASTVDQLPRAVNFLLIALNIYALNKAMIQFKDGTYSQDLALFVKGLCENTLTILSTAASAMKVIYERFKTALGEAYAASRNAILATTFNNFATRCNAIAYAISAIYYLYKVYDFAVEEEYGLAVLAYGQFVASSSLLILTLFFATQPGYGWAVALCLILMISYDYVIYLLTPTPFQSWLKKTVFGTSENNRYKDSYKERYAYIQMTDKSGFKTIPAEGH